MKQRIDSKSQKFVVHPYLCGTDDMETNKFTNYYACVTYVMWHLLRKVSMSRFYLCHLLKNPLPKTLSLEVLQSIHLSYDLANPQSKVQVPDFVPDFEVEDEDLGLGRRRREEKKRSRFLNTKIQHIWVHLQNLIYFLLLDRLILMPNLLDRLCQCSIRVQGFNFSVCSKPHIYFASESASEFTRMWGILVI